MAKMCFKAVLFLAGGLVATSVIADCDSLTKYATKSANTTTICDEELGVLFGYDTGKKEPAWAVYQLKTNLPNTFIRNRGEYGAIGSVANSDQRQSEEYTKTSFDKAYLVPPINVVRHASAITNSFRMNNIFPVDRALWRGNFGYNLTTLNREERAIPSEKGAVFVVTGLVSGSKESNQNNARPDLAQPQYLYKVYFREQYELTKSLLLPINKTQLVINTTELITSIDCIESLSGHDLFYRFAHDEQADIENRMATSSNIWAVRDGKGGEGVCAR